MPTIYQLKYLALHLVHNGAPRVLLFNLFSWEMVPEEFLIVVSLSSLFSELTEIFSIWKYIANFLSHKIWMYRSILNVLTNRTNQQIKKCTYWNIYLFGKWWLRCQGVFWQLLLLSSSHSRKHCHYHQKSICKSSTMHLRDLSLVHLEKPLLIFQGQTRRAEAKGVVCTAY